MVADTGVNVGCGVPRVQGPSGTDCMDIHQGELCGLSASHALPWDGLREDDPTDFVAGVSER